MDWFYEDANSLFVRFMTCASLHGAVEPDLTLCLQPVEADIRRKRVDFRF
jgi:hypothetical protein